MTLADSPAQQELLEKSRPRLIVLVAQGYSWSTVSHGEQDVESWTRRMVEHQRIEVLSHSGAGEDS